ncbi:MAG: radical SAM protein [Leptonema sp. (in: Bacteria)]|nr:radical SAM protein [Leptonema sp. (in: bacteria)]
MHKMLTDPLFDFDIQITKDQENQKLYLQLIAGSTLPEPAKQYLSDYLQQTHKYKNIAHTNNQIRFSLYQPVINSPAGKRSLYMRLRRKYHRERLPQAATIGVTRACQCKCAHCSADYHMASKNKQLTDLELQSAVKEAVDLGVTNIILLGGEPLLRKGLESIIQSVDSQKAQTVLFTNGEYLTKERCQSLVNSGLTGIFVSIDSTDQEEHERLRKRPGLFKKIQEGIFNAKEAGLFVAISSYLTTERVNDFVFEKTLELGKELKVNEVTFFDAIPVGRMSHDQSDRCTFLDLPARQRIAALTKEYRAKPEYPGVTPQSVLTSEIGSSFCFAANTQFYLSSTGQMCPCDFTPLTIGRYPNESISELWAKMIATPQYRRRSKTCRMQDPDFRKNNIAKIPENSLLPYSLSKLAELSRS